ncbi:MAG: hemolysin family protein [Acidobacteria bacterium]|nr:hemolysin family protein [Acidobacteriota bacterium]
MLLPGIALFAFLVVLYAFFSAAETSFIAVNPYALQSREKAGSKRAALVRRMKSRTGEFLATILIGNTLVNVAASAIATSLCISLIPDQGKAVLAATLATTLIILIFAETAPKTFAAQAPLKTALFLGYPIRALMFLLYPLIKALSIVTGLLVPASRRRDAFQTAQLNEEEARLALHAGARGLSSLRRRIVSGALDLGYRPVREVMVPRPEIRAIEIEARPEDVLAEVRSSGYSRYPVYRGRLDSVEGVIHSKDIIGYFIDKKEFSVKALLRKPFFVPELASLEQRRRAGDPRGHPRGDRRRHPGRARRPGRGLVHASRRRPRPGRRGRAGQGRQRPPPAGRPGEEGLHDAGRLLPV